MKPIVVIVIVLSVAKCVELAAVTQRVPTKKPVKAVPQIKKATAQPLTASTVPRKTLVLLTDADEATEVSGLKRRKNGVNLQINVKKEKKPPGKKKPAPTKKKKKVEDVNESEESIFSDLSQGYKKVYGTITNWWRDLESSFSLTPVKHSAGVKVKKDTKESKEKPGPKPSKPPPKKKQPTKKKVPPPKKDVKQKAESWFDLQKIVMVLGSIVAVLDLFGIR